MSLSRFAQSNCYVLNIKPGLKDMVPAALAADQLIIGWTDAAELLDASLSLKDFREILHSHYYSDSKTRGRAGSAAGNMWRFLREMQPDDLVLVPHRKEFYVAVVVGNATHDNSLAEGGFRRAAIWLNEKRPFSRAKVPPAIDAAMKERKTCYRANFIRPALLEFLAPLLLSELESVELAQDLAD